MSKLELGSLSHPPQTKKKKKKFEFQKVLVSSSKVCVRPIVSPYPFSQELCEVGAIITPVLQIRKPKHADVRLNHPKSPHQWYVWGQELK